jgi:hypothetical protein
MAPDSHLVCARLSGRADRKSWAALRRKVFHDPPTERNRVWQTDFSEFETAGGAVAHLRGHRLRH